MAQYLHRDQMRSVVGRKNNRGISKPKVKLGLEKKEYLFDVVSRLHHQLFVGADGLRECVDEVLSQIVAL